MFFSALLIAAAGVIPAFPPAGIYRYAASLNGQSIGAWSVSVKPGSDGNEIDEDSTANFAGMQMSATAALILGPDLAPRSYSGNYRATGQAQTVTATLSSGTATITGGIGGSTRTLSLEPGTNHFVVIEPALLAGLFALPAQFAAWGDTSVTWIAPITGQEEMITRNPATQSARPSGVPTQDLELSVGGQIPFTIWYDPATLAPDEVIVPSQNAVLTRVRS